jgi:hypothetical protein
MRGHDDREILEVFRDLEDGLRAAPVLGAYAKVGEGLEHRHGVT